MVVNSSVQRLKSENKLESVPDINAHFSESRPYFGSTQSAVFVNIQRREHKPKISSIEIINLEYPA